MGFLKFLKRDTEKEATGLMLSLTKIQAYVEQNDIMEFLAQKGAERVTFGVSSGYERNRFFDKRYYIGGKEYLDVASFLRELRAWTDADGNIKVLKVDDVDARKYFV